MVRFENKLRRRLCEGASLDKIEHCGSVLFGHEGLRNVATRLALVPKPRKVKIDNGGGVARDHPDAEFIGHKSDELHAGLVSRPEPGQRWGVILSWLPKNVLAILKEAGKHVLRHPVVGVAAAAETADGKWVLIRRADTGTWALPGGTLEWNETLRDSLGRELLEEAGIASFDFERVVGVYSRPDRDVRFHAVTVVVKCRVPTPSQPPLNPLEIREVALFSRGDIPPLAFGMSDMLQMAFSKEEVVLE